MWSIIGPYVKLTALDSLQIAFFRCLICVAFFIFLIKPKNINFHPLMISMSLSFAVMNVTFISAMKFTTAANASILQYLAPLWVAIGSVYIIKESIKKNEFISLGLGMIGALYILYHTDPGSTLGVGLALGAGVCYASVILHFKLLKDYSTVWLNFLNLVAATAVLSPFYFQGTIQNPSTEEFFYLTIFSIFQFAIPYMLIGYAIKKFSPVKVGVFTLLEPILTALLTWWIVHEEPGIPTIIGGCFIFMGLLFNLKPNKKSI